MQSLHLHPFTLEGSYEESHQDSSIVVEFELDPLQSILRLNFHLPCFLETNDCTNLGERRHELWKETCFECFIAYEDGSYQEWNFNLSGSWQSYDFSSYRRPQPPHMAQVDASEMEYLLKGRQLYLELPVRKRVESLNPCVVINGDEFYAHRHSSDKADFHDLTNFISLK